MAWSITAPAAVAKNLPGGTYRPGLEGATFTTSGDAAQERKQLNAALDAVHRLAGAVGKNPSLLNITCTGTGTADGVGPGETITVTVTAAGP